MSLDGLGWNRRCQSLVSGVLISSFFFWCKACISYVQGLQKGALGLGSQEVKHFTQVTMTRNIKEIVDAITSLGTKLFSRAGSRSKYVQRR